MLEFDILTIFPKIFDSYFSESIIKRALKKKLIKIRIYDLRRFSKDKHRKVDDRPYGGGPGMILKVEPIYEALKEIKKIRKRKRKIVLLTPKGKLFDQKLAQSFSQLDQLVLICGRYEGVDARVEEFVDEKISVGNFILTGGELAAMIIVDAVTRLVPGVIRKESLKEESFLESFGKYEYPQYTRPAVFKVKIKGKIKKLSVPEVLLSGNHKKIEEWRKAHLT